MKSSLANTNAKNAPGIGIDPTAGGSTGKGIDYKSLLANLPTTPEKLKKSNDSIEKRSSSSAKPTRKDYPITHTPSIPTTPC
jgi:hypothetical protein